MIASNMQVKMPALHELWHPRPLTAHKGTMGHAALIVGSKGMAGAAILAAEACLRSGIGKLTICTPDVNRPILQATVPEAIVTETFRPCMPYDAVGIGPGIGINPKLVADGIGQVSCPLVIDADAINTLARNPELIALLPHDSILTPHPKEAERLTGSCAVKDVALFAARHKVFTILKGHPNHICTPDGTVMEVEVGNPGMATAGSGDVLTGILTGLLAQGYPPLSSVILGVHLHGWAGDFAAEELGEECLLARDIIRHMPEAFKKLKN